ncbi:MAG: rhomboid family intramembrane serine protease [Planctomycetes bacterium]|nr:rhomboid family intramembrane serine protease [Planctomycetota bacterium]
MGIYERDYNRDGYSGGSCRRQILLPRVTPVVKWLLIINLSVFVVTFLLRKTSLGAGIHNWFSVSTVTVGQSLQLWRVITYQFLHSTDDVWHVLFNMLGLYFFGPNLETLWSSKRFLKFYLICGAMGGFAYPILYHIGFPMMSQGNLVGASGAVLGIIAACAIMFPHAKVYIYGIIPVPLLVLAGILVLVSVVGLLSGDNAGGEAAHLAGMAVGAVYVLWQPWLQKTRMKMNNGKWEKKITEERDLYVNVDEILDKVHKSGMKSLTRKEKKILRQATENEQSR